MKNTILLFLLMAITTLAYSQTTNVGRLRIRNAPTGNASVDQVLTIKSSGLVRKVNVSELSGSAQELSILGNTLSISDGTNTIDLSGYLDNTDSQTLSLSSNSLTITGGSGSVDLSSYLDNTDNQTLSLSGQDISISNGNTITLPSTGGGGELEALDEGNGIGYRISGKDPLNYGNIGLDAVDFTTNTSVSTSIGATGFGSFAAQRGQAGGIFSSAFGISSASGNYSFSTGFQSNSSGVESFSANRLTNADGTNSSAFGFTTTASSFAEMVVGCNSTLYTPSSQVSYNSSDRIFTVGNGLNSSNRSDALVILKNGTVSAPSQTIANIDAGDGTTLVTKDWIGTNIDWTNITLNANWSADLAQYKKVRGVVTVRLVNVRLDTGNTLGVTNFTIANIPLTASPVGNLVEIDCHGVNVNAFVTPTTNRSIIAILPNGQIQMNNTTDSNTGVNLHAVFTQ